MCSARSSASDYSFRYEVCCTVEHHPSAFTRILIWLYTVLDIDCPLVTRSRSGLTMSMNHVATLGHKFYILLPANNTTKYLIVFYIMFLCELFGYGTFEWRSNITV